METPHLQYRLVSNDGLNKEISDLKLQMEGLEPDSPEYEYDKLNLAREERELEIRKENPDLNPSTQAGAKALAEIIGQDPEIQSLNSKIEALINAYPRVCTSWGIPMV